MDPTIATALKDSQGNYPGVILGIFIALWIFDKVLDLLRKKKLNGQGELSERVANAVHQVDEMHQFYRWKGEPMLVALEKMAAENTRTNMEICKTLKSIQEANEKTHTALDGIKCRVP